MSSSTDTTSQEARLAGVKAALASTASRTLALYFSRPIRLFRPSKISGWHSLGDQSLPLLIKQNGWSVIPRHFFPPLVVNALLGAVLWTSYTETSSLLNTHAPALSPITVAALSGGVAGAVQALAAAPAENVRIVLEGGRIRGSWSSAWKEVFAGTESLSSKSPKVAHHRAEMRKVQQWMSEVRYMAGRGWHGLGFGVAKDTCAFTIFFAIFETSRRSAAKARSFSKRVLNSMATQVSSTSKTHIPRVVHSTAIVSGGLVAGLAYEFVSRPFDAARRAIHAPQGRKSSVTKILLKKVQEDGIVGFFRDPMRNAPSSRFKWLRMIGRVGPWGIGFLAWENFGPDLLL
ncbi:hypothetical protein M422DRAFT_69462 [Sphaerobolus stellatus SS14]|uniref:Mitochondrial carrier n=1 Tax=Sphaerobolus stellatus (strain SS14) TaxID=990650 RepID=A0A0C9V625_SPHS4|nr:hypothetical protein M422DRAFT_72313 [Sphaerobolus stellatus SS14]KIJ37027.1 hypothetical protein M422DRAFT_69462 [Sphaerobolus stellatus SS14]